MHASRAKVLLSFAAVYVIWGSTYLAVRIAGRTLPVLVIGAARPLISCVVLLMVCAVTGRSLRVSRREAPRLMLIGVLLMTLNNVLLTAGTQLVPTGMASLIMATTPIMVALLGWSHDRLSLRGWAGTLLATLGIAALMWPRLHSDTVSEQHLAAGTLLLLGAAFAFALVAVLSRRWQFQADIWVATTWQVTTAAIVNVAIAFAVDGNWLHRRWTWPAVTAIAYIATFGAVLTLAAFTYLLRHVEATKVATYAFVNPVVAVLLGVLLLHERFVAAEMFGMLLVLAGVILVVVRPRVMASVR